MDSHSPLIQEAAEWFVRLHDGPPSQATRALFIDWLLLSPHHIRAFLDVTEAILGLGAATRDLNKDALVATATSAHEASNVVPLERLPVRSLPLRSPGVRRWICGVVAALALCAGGLTGWIACEHRHNAHLAAAAPKC